MAKYILRNILLLVAISLQLNLSAQNKATGLQTDLINDAGTLYQNGYRSDKTMAELNDSEFSQYQYAAIRSSRPTFSWIVPQCEGEHNVIQRSYQIAVDDNPADAAAHTGKVWNSGRQKSTQSIAVAYGGADLKPNKTYYWSVKVTTNSSRGDWSKTEIESETILRIIPPADSPEGVANSNSENLPTDHIYRFWSRLFLFAGTHIREPTRQ